MALSFYSLSPAWAEAGAARPGCRQEEAGLLQDALLKAQASHTEASAQLTSNLLLRRQQVQDELAAADLPGLQYVLIAQHALNTGHCCYIDVALFCAQLPCLICSLRTFV